VRAHDAAVAAVGPAIWLGGEPTFTDRFSDDPQWIGAAAGDEKVARARAVLRELHARTPGALVLRTVGRQYPGEERPRWSLGLYRWRDGTRAWAGPADPIVAGAAGKVPDGGVAEALRDTLGFRLVARGMGVTAFRAEGAVLVERVIFAPRGPAPVATEEVRAWWLRPPVAEQRVPEEGPRDMLAEAGHYLAACAVISPAAFPEDVGAVFVEIPLFHDIELFWTFMDELGSAAREVGVTRLVIGGHGPPVDGSVAFATLTPDPAVLEVNMAPSADLSGYLDDLECIYAAADAAALHPERLYYNGDVADSGGGGQVTMGGPSPLESPFLCEPRLLPRLLAYVVRHPSLSYLFATPFAGGSGQSPRVDEGARESFEELGLALHLLASTPAPAPAEVWRSLAPFLVDRFGNTHRSEVNIEKLWNPYFSGRGLLGLVEFRALGMPPTVRRAVAVAGVLRAVVALCVRGVTDVTLVAWGAALHDRFALPLYLRRDLADVLADLDAAGLGLLPPLRDELWDDSGRVIGVVSEGDFELVLKRAIEYWPLVGDLTRQEGTSRLIDPGTQRVEVVLRAEGATLETWRLVVAGHEVPMVREVDVNGQEVRVTGVRLRAFVPAVPLHPLLQARPRLELTVVAPGGRKAWGVTLHDWRPDGSAYEALPADGRDAARRRAERVEVREVPAPGEGVEYLQAPAKALTRYCFDTRWL
jgi:uncharacterized protein (DUF2126 family)